MYHFLCCKSKTISEQSWWGNCSGIALRALIPPCHNLTTSKVHRPQRVTERKPEVVLNEAQVLWYGGSVQERPINIEFVPQETTKVTTRMSGGYPGG